MKNKFELVDVKYIDMYHFQMWEGKFLDKEQEGREIYLYANISNFDSETFEESEVYVYPYSYEDLYCADDYTMKLNSETEKYMKQSILDYVKKNMMDYKIYQLKDIRDTDYAFRDWECAKEHGFNFNDYKEIYSGKMNQKNILDNLWRVFNIEHPADFRGHSLSVSDVIALKKPENDYWYYYYCDSFGWKEITEVMI